MSDNILNSILPYSFLGTTKQGFSYTKILEINIDKSSLFINKIYNLKIFNDGRLSDESISYCDLFIRVVKEKASDDISVKCKCDIVTKHKNTRFEELHLLHEKTETYDKIHLFTKSDNSYSRTCVKIDFINDAKNLNDIKFYSIPLTSDEFNVLNFTEINIDYGKYIKGDLEVNDNSTFNQNLTIKGYLNLSKTVSIKNRDVEIGSSANPLERIYSNYVIANNGNTIPVKETKPTDVLFNGLVIFHIPTKKIIIYFDGNWYDTNGNVV